MVVNKESLKVLIIFLHFFEFFLFWLSIMAFGDSLLSFGGLFVNFRKGLYKCGVIWFIVEKGKTSLIFDSIGYNCKTRELIPSPNWRFFQTLFNSHEFHWFILFGDFVEIFVERMLQLFLKFFGHVFDS